MSTNRWILPSEVLAHNTSQDCWVSFLGEVRDLTSLVKDHTNDPEYQPIIKAAGTDISHWFNPKTKDIRMIEKATSKDDYILVSTFDNKYTFRNFIKIVDIRTSLIFLLKCNSKKIDFKIIRLMGGEPLLHPHVNKFIEVTRKYYPSNDIRIVSNGILIPAMKQDFWDTMKENRIKFDLSKYPPASDNFSKYLGLSSAFLFSPNISGKPKPMKHTS